MRLPHNADHVLTQLHHPGSTRIRLLSLRNAASEIQISPSVVVHQHRRIKQPEHIAAVRCLPGDQALPKRIPKRSRRAVRLQHTDAASRICKIEKKLRLSFNFLPGGRRRPRIAGPDSGALFRCRLYGAMIRKVHHIRRGNHTDLTDLPIGIFRDLPLPVIFKGIPGHINIHSVTIDHGVRICAKALCHQGVRMVHSLIALRKLYSLKKFHIILLFFLWLRGRHLHHSGVRPGSPFPAAGGKKKASPYCKT